MNTKILMSTFLIIASTALSMPAQATPWDGAWLTLTQSATLPAKKGIDGDGSGNAANNTLNKTAQKHKSGKCLMNITDSGPDSYHERLFCSLDNDVWEYVSHYYGIQTADKASNVIGSHELEIYTPEEGQSSGFHNKFMAYKGTLLLSAKLNAEGKIKSVTSSGNRGMFYLGNTLSDIFGTTHSGSLIIKLAKTVDVTPGVLACLNSVNGGTPVANCEPDMDM